MNAKRDRGRKEGKKKRRPEGSNARLPEVHQDGKKREMEEHQEHVKKEAINEEAEQITGKLAKNGGQMRIANLVAGRSVMGELNRRNQV